MLNSNSLTASSEGKKCWRILITDSEFASTIPDIATRFENMKLICTDEAHDVRMIASENEFDGLITQFVPVDKSLLDSMKGLRVVLKMGRNYYNVDVNAARERGLTFALIPRKGPNCVAELALTLILSLSKDLLFSHKGVADCAYRLRGLRPMLTTQNKYPFRWMHNERVHEIRGKILGVVGMGEIGRELSIRAEVMGMRVIYYDTRRLSPELEQRFGVEFRDLNALMQESDYVTLHVPHTPETEKMIGREELALMKHSAFLVNTCRGNVVDEDALTDSLANNRIAGAGLDVMAYEPVPADSPLCKLDNVILTPHIGGGTGTNRALELGEALEEMERILSGERPRFEPR